MGVIHKNTTVTPTKMELLTPWLPAQPWYAGQGGVPELTRVGGFRIDDPEGEVGIEFMAVTDVSSDEAVTYHVPLTYRGSECAEAADGLVGTTEHGVLGHRWVYDGTRDPVLVTQLVALIQGDVPAQAQSESHTLDLTVLSQPVISDRLVATGSAVAANGPDGTDLRVTTADATGHPAAGIIVRVNRVLRPGNATLADADSGHQGGPGVSATWRLPDGTRTRGVYVTARHA